MFNVNAPVNVNAVIDTDTGVRTVCTTDACSWYPEHAVLVAGVQEVTTVRQIDVPGTNAELLREALLPLLDAGDVYLSGSLRGLLPAEDMTVQSKGERTILYQAEPTVLTGTVPLRNVSLTVQVRHDVGVVVPPLTVTAVQNVQYHSGNAVEVPGII